MDDENLDYQNDDEIQEDLQANNADEISSDDNISSDIPQEAAQEYEDDNEESNQENVDDKLEKTSKKNLREHLAELQRSKYQALKENERLRAENERLNMLTGQAANTALQHYEDAAVQRLEIAKDLKRKSYDSGDIDEQLKADVALQSAMYELQNLHQKKAEHLSAQNSYYSAQQFQSAPPVEQELQARQWIERNSWFNPASENYDEWMAREVDNYSNHLDSNLYHAGRANQIMSPEYFQAIDNHARQLMEHKMRSNKGLNMRSAPRTVNPVRGGGNRGNERVRMELSDDEKKVANSLKNLGVTPELYLRSKMALNKNGM